ncbi:MAG: phage tail assembly chaperone [Clostridia bacterium]
MKSESNLEPKKFEIENIHGDRCDIVLNTNIQEVVEEENTRYIFDSYRMNICYNEGIENKIENDFDELIKSAAKKEYDELAAEIRKERNRLLLETDADMCIDRLQIKLPEDLSATNLLSGMKQFIEGLANIFNGKMAKYRQELRDITKQSGFPYNVVWPNKEDLE